MNRDELPTTDDIDASVWDYLLPGEFTEYAGVYSVSDNNPVALELPDRIARIHAFHGVSPEGFASTDIAMLAELDDGAWITCVAWSDTTGYGCRSDVQWRWAASRDHAVSLGLDRAARRVLGLALPGEADGGESA